ncbi:hypothetical protein P12x_001255 [Tundrisphaera lichenicola]|uniref:hypothetical protein n=1 Tax=Tundrisphaera lichenicola TaxID=2029860 RepID=UPI003EB98128
MLWRNLCLVRAITASGLLTCSMLGASAAGEPREPIPGDDAQTETVKVLDAEKAGDLAVVVRGQGQDRVRLSLKNNSARRLNIVLPPGLVASSSAGQAGGPGGGGGFQSMGLGAATNRSGGFGQFAGAAGEAGFRSVAPSDSNGVIVPAGQKVDLEIPAVCLNFGMPTPTSKDHFRLVEVEDFTKDVRVHKALKALATLGTSHGTAQAAMWRVCNDVPFEQMIANSGKAVNQAEVALAARFLQALDQSADSVDPAYLTEARLFLTINGEGDLAREAKRLSGEIEGLRLLGLPARISPAGVEPKASAPAVHLGVTLVSGPAGETRARVVVQSSTGIQDAVWSPLGQVSFVEGSAPSAIDAASMARAIDHAVGSAFVTAKVSRRSTTSTTLRIENRLPFTVANLTVKAGQSSGAPLVTIPALGVGPGRAGLATIPASGGSIDRVELNGL